MNRTENSHLTPPDRADKFLIRKQNSEVLGADIYKTVIDQMPQKFLIINNKHQIIFANNTVARMLKMSKESILGQRPGELLSCINAGKSINGCGNCSACNTCGALDAIIKGLRGKESLQECRIRMKNRETLNLKVWTKPFQVITATYLILILFDIGDEKKREAMEKIFFHDVMNTAGGILGYTRKLQDCEKEKDISRYRETINNLQGMITKMVGQIREQRDLISAEKEEGDVPLHDEIHSRHLLEETVSLFRNHDLGEKTRIYIRDRSESFSFCSDRILIQRILSNMMLNALEASKENDPITLESLLTKEGIRISISNPAYILPEIREQIFQRFFSTKGKGRGQGTYGMKLLSNRYLKGDVTFVSTEDKGTCFTLSLPYKPLLKENEEVDYRVSEEESERILVVDDSEANCEVIRYILDVQGYKSRTVGSALKAIEMMKNCSYKMVLMNMNMPEVSGAEAFRMIRANHKFDQIPVIAMTVNSPAGGGLFTMDDTIEKPFNSEQVNRVLRKWINR